MVHDIIAPFTSAYLCSDLACEYVCIIFAEGVYCPNLPHQIYQGVFGMHLPFLFGTLMVCDMLHVGVACRQYPQAASAGHHATTAQSQHNRHWYVLPQRIALSLFMRCAARCIDAASLKPSVRSFTTDFQAYRSVRDALALFAVLKMLYML